MGSPYPWHYSIRWLLYYFRPSTKNHTKIGIAPLTQRFTDTPASECTRIAFFGDLMCMRFDQVPEVDEAVAQVLRQADLVVGNCEAPLVFDELRPHAHHLTHFGMSTEYLETFLDALGVDRKRCLLSVANNHIGDQEAPGLKKTVEKLRGLDITPFGTSDAPIVVHQSARTPAGTDRFTLGFVAWTQWLNFPVFTEGTGVWRQTDVAAQDWEALRKEAGVDCLIATPHWDYEFQHFPRAETRTLARQLLEGPFDLIVGHHPHVLQPVECFDDGLCCYSVGNLNGPSYSRVAWPVKLGGIFNLLVGPDGRVVEYSFFPTAQTIRENFSSRIQPLDAEQHALLAERLRVVYSDRK